MKADVLNRYERDVEGRLLIDVSADSVEDLYSHWDRTAPFIRRDLDGELTDYLIDSADELRGQNFAIQFSFHHKVDNDALLRITKSINVFFAYLAEKETQQIASMLRKSMLFLLTGLVMLSVAVWVNEWVGSGRTMLENVFAEGLTIAAWVALWQALATFLVEWFPQRKRIKLYRDLSAAPLSFRQLSPDLPDATAS